MADLVYAVKGQAETLAAQEAQRKAALATRQEFEAGAKATQSWDAALTKLKGQGESALRSIRTEQEKIVDQIAKIEAAQEEGLIPPEEAEEALGRLRQKWVDVDAATVEAKDKTLDYERSQQQLKTTAEAALESVKTELEEVQDQIDAVEQASRDGLIDSAEAEKAIVRLQQKVKDLETDTKGIGSSIEAVLAKAFDPVKILKIGVSFIGVQAAINQLKAYVEDAIKRIDKRVEVQERIGKEAAGRIQGFASTFGLGLPAALPTSEDLADATRLNRLQGFEQTQKKGYENLARIGPDDLLTTKQLEQMTDIMRELGIGGVTQYLLKLPYQFPGSEGGVGITRGEAAEIYEQAGRVQSRASISNEESIPQLIRILEAQGNADAQFRAEQLRKLDEMIMHLRDGGGIPVSAE